jgi:release factor glutamine methyltransferase
MNVQTWKILDLLQTTTRYFDERQTGSSRLAAERLLAHVLACKRVDLYLKAERVLTTEELGQYRQLVKAYAAGEPMQYLVGETEFMGFSLRSDRRALIPRPETEILVEAVAKRLAAQAHPLRLLELGAGCGAIAVALARMLPQAEVWTLELEAGAAALARENSRRHGVEDRVRVLVMDGFGAVVPELEATFDGVVSNPPYVRTPDLAGLPARVRDHEPWAALDGGEDGLRFYRLLCSEGLRFLAPGGTLGVEIGADQGEAVPALFRQAGLQEVALLKDYAGLDRVVLGRR